MCHHTHHAEKEQKSTTIPKMISGMAPCTKETKVNISELVNGVYLLKVTNDEGRVASRRIIKM